jgi:hypothetical protein
VSSQGRDQWFAVVVRAFARDQRVTVGEGKGFGSGALKVDGKLFAMISSRGQFVVKLPEGRVRSLVAKGEGEPFNTGGGRLMREWVALDGRESRWLALAKEARQFVGGA